LLFHKLYSIPLHVTICSQLRKGFAPTSSTSLCFASFGAVDAGVDGPGATLVCSLVECSSVSRVRGGPWEKAKLRSNLCEARRWFVVVAFWGKKNVTRTPHCSRAFFMLCNSAFEEWEQETRPTHHLYREWGQHKVKFVSKLEEASRLTHRLGERPPSLPPLTSLILLFGNTHTHNSLLFCY
jgi:hypothetical protein